MSFRLTILLVLVFLSSACDGVRSKTHLVSGEETAACRAQRFLEVNGYLERPAISDHTKISLEMMDGVQYKKNGQMDWDALLAARHNTYSGRLYGVMRSEGGFDVAYKTDGGFSCVTVGDSAQSPVVLHEASCHLVGAVRRVREKSLSCPEN